MSYLIQKMDSIWQAQLEQRLKYARNLNFSTIPGSEEDFSCPKKKVSRDPMSHRIIEKRRRDRMNNCLADLSRLIPSNYLKKGRGRIEKTEIIEMAIKHLKQLQAHQCKTSNLNMDGRQVNSMEVDTAQSLGQYRLGYQECVSETMHFLVEIEGLYPGDSLCLKLMNHLQKHCDKLVNGENDEFELKATNTSVQKDIVNFASPPLSQCHSEEEFPSKVLEKALRNGSSAAKKSFQVETPVTDCNEGGSQLREMLQNPSLTIQRGRSLSMGSSRPVSTTSSSSSSSGGGGSFRCDEGAYKFKRNIKERFKADQQVRIVGTPSDTDGSEVDIECDVTSMSENFHTMHERTADERSQTPIVTETKFSSVLNEQNRLNVHSQSKSCDTLTESVTDSSKVVKSRPGSVLETLTMRRMVSPNGSTSPLQDIKAHHRSGYHPYANNTNGNHEIRSQVSENLPQRHPNDIPIFALHPKGGFYVPMTVDPSVLMPYMSAISNASPNILHHVGIAVYFYNGTAKIPSAQRIVLETSAVQIAQQCSQDPCLRPWSSLAIHE